MDIRLRTVEIKKGSKIIVTHKRVDAETAEKLYIEWSSGRDTMKYRWTFTRVVVSTGFYVEYHAIRSIRGAMQIGKHVETFCVTAHESE